MPICRPSTEVMVVLCRVWHTKAVYPLRGVCWSTVQISTSHYTMAGLYTYLSVSTQYLIKSLGRYLR